MTETLSSPLPAPLVKTLKSATSFTLTPFGWRPLPVALQALGFVAKKETTWRVKGKYMAETNRGSQRAASG